MGVVGWIVLGAVAGLIAERVTGNRTGLLMAAVIGIAGALVGGFVAARLFGVETMDTFFDLSTWVTAILGAVGLFLLFGAVRGRSRRSRRAKSWLGPRR